MTVGGRLCTRVTDLAFLGRLDDLSRPARLVLYVLASVARDEPHKDPNMYWGGWPYLARAALGYKDYTPLAHRSVARYMAELMAAGFIEKDDARTQHGTVCYTLTLPEPLPELTSAEHKTIGNILQKKPRPYRPPDAPPR
jgi:hypothetical protein